MWSSLRFPWRSRCDNSTCVQHFYRSNYECFPTEFPDLFLHVECHLPPVIHKVISVSGLNQSIATTLEGLFCGPDPARCANFAADIATGQVSFDYLGQGVPASRRRRTTNPCEADFYSVPNATATMLACCQTEGIDCTDFQLTANFTGTPEFPSVGSSDFVACETDVDCPSELSLCVDNACVAAAGHSSTTTEASATTAPVPTTPTTPTTTTPLPPDEAFPARSTARSELWRASRRRPFGRGVGHGCGWRRDWGGGIGGGGIGGGSEAGSLMESFL